MTDAAIAAPPKGKSKRKLLVPVAGALVLAGGGAGGYFYARSTAPAHEKPGKDYPKLVLRSETPEEPAGEGDGEKKPVRREGTVEVDTDTVVIDPKKYAVAYYPIGQAITANLAGGSGFVQLQLSASTYFDSKVGDAIARNEVPIRSAILLVLSDQDGASLATPEGKQALQRVLAKTVNHVLREREGFGGVDNVYFQTLVVQ